LKIAQTFSITAQTILIEAMARTSNNRVGRMPIAGSSPQLLHMPEAVGGHEDHAEKKGVVPGMD
jgi:hypothetical protein